MNTYLYTKWGRDLSAEHVLEEYPRPKLCRKEYVILNGLWQYAFTGSRHFPEKYDGEILVPFSPEAPLSRVGCQLQPDEYLHYYRELVIPGTNGKRRWILHFGAVDQSCCVYINEQKAGRHSGGYLPFFIDITPFVKTGANTLRVVVKDLSDSSYHSKGKQSLERGGMWYTAQSGIWQTVWMEPVPEQYLSDLLIEPDYDGSKIVIAANSNHPEERFPVHAEISYQGKFLKEADFFSGEAAEVALEHFESWTPETPHLYDIRLSMCEDAVSSYFAMRKIGVGKDIRGIPRFFLNNKPYFHCGVLDQGYYPDGLYTAPSDEALQHDIRAMKDLGFNMLRKHMKIEPARWYYHCDRIGMLVWQDMVCGGDNYLSWFIFLPNAFPWIGRSVRDRHDFLFSRRERRGKIEYIREMKETVKLLRHYPCVAAWVPFNEGWGQFQALAVSRMIRDMDPSRIIDEASGWFDQGGGDVHSIHQYWGHFFIRKRRRVVAITECGGFSYRIPGHCLCDEVYGYRKYKSGRKLTKGISDFWTWELIPNVKRGLSAVIYTQVSDVEDEVNGFLTYDRECMKVDRAVMRKKNRELLGAFLEAVGRRK